MNSPLAFIAQLWIMATTKSDPPFCPLLLFRSGSVGKGVCMIKYGRSQMVFNNGYKPKVTWMWWNSQRGLLNWYRPTSLQWQYWDGKKCHCKRVSLYPRIFNIRRSFFGPKNCHCKLFRKMFSDSSTSSWLKCSCHAAQASKENFQKTCHKTFFITCRRRQYSRLETTREGPEPPTATYAYHHFWFNLWLTDSSVRPSISLNSLLLHCLCRTLQTRQTRGEG